MDTDVLGAGFVHLLCAGNFDIGLANAGTSLRISVPTHMSGRKLALSDDSGPRTRPSVSNEAHFLVNVL